ncbi:MAG TPA: hypothetical protein VF600_12855 [Abditibacteriaceae bacterium]|jgi:hypothetical protein
MLMRFRWFIPLFVLAFAFVVEAAPKGAPSPIVATPTPAVPTLNEVLMANNQAVIQISSMYRDFGLLLTLIVSVVGVVLTWFGYLAKKSVQDFIAEWKDKLDKIEKDMEASEAKLREAVERAEQSAVRAAEHERASDEALKNLRSLSQPPQSDEMTAGEEEELSASLQDVLPASNEEENRNG